MKFPAKLTAELKRWNGGDGISPLDWILCVGNFDHFAGYARLFWPEFTELEDRVFLRDLLQGREKEFLESDPSERSELQLMINALDISMLFGGAGDEITDDHLLYLAEILKQSWSMKLESFYPNRKTRVILDNNLDERGIGELLLTVSEDVT